MRNAATCFIVLSQREEKFRTFLDEFQLMHLKCVERFKFLIKSQHIFLFEIFNWFNPTLVVCFFSISLGYARQYQHVRRRKT